MYFSHCCQHEDETIVVGMTNGILSVKHRKSEAKKDSLPRRRRPAYRTFIKGKNYMKQRVFICFLYFFKGEFCQSSQLLLCTLLKSLVCMAFSFILHFSIPDLSLDCLIGDITDEKWGIGTTLFNTLNYNSVIVLYHIQNNSFHTLSDLIFYYW